MNSSRRSASRLAALLLAFAVAVAACGGTDTDGVADVGTDVDAVDSEDNNDQEGTVEQSSDIDESSATEENSETEENGATEEDSEIEESSETETLSPDDELAERTAVVNEAQWADNVSISISGDAVSFQSDGLPAHEFLDTYLGDGPDGKFIAGGVESYDASFEFPVVPTPAGSPEDTPNGVIGVSISGAVFFNPFEGDGSGTVANDDNSTIDGIPFIDACGGHPLPNATQYHYHGVPLCVTDAIDTPGEHSVLIGYLFDGYPIYGPQDVGGDEATDLDACMGHVGPTPEFEGDTYHYHTSAEANYISECFTGVATSNGRGGRR